jgi:CRISPR-associated endonuclease/helicase Cas3
MDPVEAVILRHAVPSDPVTGLSGLQALMMDDEAPVRIFSAPTGAGKSYAFQRAMRKGARILFIVPTRRLAQNIAQGLVADLVDAGWEHEEARARVAIWSSDERARLEAERPGLQIGKFRLAQLRDDGGPLSKGMMIVATQESVVHLLLGRTPGGDAMDPHSIYDFLRLDHFVIDEFHTVDARGMGLACALASITTRIEGGAKLTFLSATPIDIRATLVAFGIAPDMISVRQEEIVTGTREETAGLRAVHGDVTLRIETGDGILAALHRHEDAIRTTLARVDGGRQLVVIYDSLKRLMADKAELAAFFDGLGVTAAERLAINSMDDSVEWSNDGAFTFGTLNDPIRFKVLVATSSVEMGVTFKAGMIVMEPGHDPCSFVQRIGRVARGDIEGKVIVHASHQQIDKLGWLRLICLNLARGPRHLSVDAFIETVLSGTRQRFKISETDLEAEDGTFRRMPQTAVWCAALFWCAMENAEWRKVIRGSFREFRPQKASRLGAMLSVLQTSANRAAQDWARAMIEEAKTLRVIMEKVVLVEPGGLSKSISWHLYASTPELIDVPSFVDDREILRVHVSRPIAEIEAQLGGLRVRRREECLMPHEQRTVMVDADRLREDWVREADGFLKRPGLIEADRAAILAAVKIVRLTGIVPAAKGLARPDVGTA